MLPKYCQSRKQFLIQGKAINTDMRVKNIGQITHQETAAKLAKLNSYGHITVTIQTILTDHLMIFTEILSPQIGLGLEAQKTGLGLGLETLRPRPCVVQPCGLVYCNVLISRSVANNNSQCNDL